MQHMVQICSDRRVMMASMALPPVPLGQSPHGLSGVLRACVTAPFWHRVAFHGHPSPFRTSSGRGIGGYQHG